MSLIGLLPTKKQFFNWNRSTYLSHGYILGLGAEGVSENTQLPVLPRKGLNYILSWVPPENTVSNQPAKSADCDPPL